MKRFTGIFMAAAVAVMAAAPGCFAADGGFALASSSPENGYAKVQSSNVMVKLYFTEDVAADTTADMFTFTDAEGKAVDFKLVADPDDATNLNLLASGDLTDDVEYTVTVSGDLESASGDTLGKDETIDFTTKSSNMGVGYMILMVIMMVFMIGSSVRDKKKKEEAKNAVGKGIEKAVETNPYKLAKERGISVQEASKVIAEEKEKARKKQEKLDKKYGPTEAEIEAGKKKAEKKAKKPEKKVYKVRTKRIVKR